MGRFWQIDCDEISGFQAGTLEVDAATLDDYDDDDDDYDDDDADDEADVEDEDAGQDENVIDESVLDRIGVHRSDIGPFVFWSG